jgi:hypothetical protein
MSKWETENHFVSWLRLCPDNRISGEKIIGKGRLPTNNRVTTALRMAASTLRLSNTYLGAQFRRLRTKLGAPCAIKAMAAKLARLVYRMLRYGMKYGDQGAAVYEAQHRQAQIKYLKWKPPSSDTKLSKRPQHKGEFLESRLTHGECVPVSRAMRLCGIFAKFNSRCIAVLCTTLHTTRFAKTVHIYMFLVTDVGQTN